MDDRHTDAMRARPAFEPLEARLHLDATLADLQVAGDMVVHRAYDGNDYEIYLYDSTGLTRITDNDTADLAPHTDGQSIVWQGYDGNDFEIYLYDGTQVRQLTDNERDDTLPRVSGSTVAWLGFNGSEIDTEVFVYNIETDTTAKITNSSVNENRVRICGANVVWYAKDGADNEIYLYNASGIKKVTNNSDNDVSPEVSETHIVWRGSGTLDVLNDYDTDDDEIYLYDIAAGTTTQLTQNDTHDNYPGLSNGSVFWSGYEPAGDREIYRYDLASGQTTRLTYTDGDELAPRTYSDGAIWTDLDDGQIYRWSDSGGTMTPLTSDAGDHTTAAMDGETLVWLGDEAIWLLDATGDASLIQFTSIGAVNEPLISVESATVAEGNGEVEMEIIVRLSAPTTHPVTLNYATANDSAVAGEDYTATSGSLTFLPGDVARSFPVTIKGERSIEPDEDFQVSISSVQGAITSAATATVTLLDDDTPDVSVMDAQVIEGNDGDGAQLRFTVHVSRPVFYDVEVTYSVGDIDNEDDRKAGLLATAGEDYAPANDQTLTFKPNQHLVQYVYVPITGDDVSENHERLILTLSAATNAAIVRGEAVGTILNDDVEISFSEGSLDYSADEGNTGEKSFSFTVELSHPSALEVGVLYATGDDLSADAAHRATADDDEAEIVGDYAPAAGELIFAPGETSKTFTVTVHGNEVIEEHETFAVTLSDAVNATIKTPTTTGEIFDDDAPRLSIADVSLVEGAPLVRIYSLKRVEGDGDSQMVFTITLSQAQSEQVTVDYEILDGTATLGEDYDVAATTGTITFAPHQTKATLALTILGDAVDEPDESVKVQLIRTGGNAELAGGNGNLATGWILNDDKSYSLPTLTCYDYWDVEGDDDGDGQPDYTSFPITITLSRALDYDISVNYTVTDGTAKDGEDYLDVADGAITFQAGDTVKSILIPVIADTESESDKTFSVSLSGATHNVRIGDGAAQATIRDDDPADLYAEFTVTLNKAAEDGTIITVDYATADDEEPEVEPVDEDDETTPEPIPFNPADADEDYLATSGSLSFVFVEGETTSLTQTLRIPIVGDRVPEEDETFRVALSNAANAKIIDEYAVATLENDDTEISFEDAYLDVVKSEGNSGTTVFHFYLKMSHQISREVKVYYSTSDGTAVGGSGEGDWDYTARQYSSAVFTLADRGDDDDGEVETDYYALLSVAVRGDTAIENDETFTLTLLDASGGVITGQTYATATIRDDDTPLASISDAQVVEGDAGETSVKLTVTLSRPNDLQAVTLDYETAVDGEFVTTTDGDGNETTEFIPADNAAEPGSDYTAVSHNTLTFAKGETSKTITLKIQGDQDVEASETFLVRLSNANGAKLDDGDATTVGDDDTGRVTILNDDTGISIDDVTIIEGNGLSSNVRLTVRLTEASTDQVSVWWMTSDGTATTLDNDYTAKGGQVLFAPGETAKEIVVKVTGDSRVEPNEAFDIVLYNEENATITDDRATVTIQDDDIPWLSIGDVEIAEGDNDQTVMEFTVSLHGQLEDEDITVEYHALGGSAVSGLDFALEAGTLTFTPGQTSKIVSVTILGDLAPEDDETFTLELRNPSANAIISDATAVGTIRNDDASVSITDAGIDEGHAGTTALIFTLSLDYASVREFRVTAATADDSAVAGEDYTAHTGEITFAAGETQQTFSVGLAGDLVTEIDETFFVLLSNPVGGVITEGWDSAVGTIVNDDSAPRITAVDGEVIEGNQGDSLLAITLMLSNPSAMAVSVDYRTLDGTALAPGDYKDTSGTAVFAPDQTEYTVEIPVHGDTVIESDSSFTLELSAPSNAEILDGTALATIRNDDTLVSIADAALAEPAQGQGAMLFHVTLSAATSFPVTVNYATSDGTATGAKDYSSVSGTLTFAAGETGKTIAVPILADLIAEEDETFTVTLSGATNAALAVATAAGVIEDDDPYPDLAIGDVQIVEGDSGVKTVVAAVTLSNPAAWPVSVDYQTVDDTATGGDDYVSTGGTLSFPPGQVTRTISLSVYGDTVAEGTEIFWINLSNASGATPPTNQAAVTINDNDQTNSGLTISVADVAVDEGDSGLTIMAFVVSLSRTAESPVSVTYQVLDGTATSADGDYWPETGTLTFQPGSATSQSIWVKVYGDTVAEADEQLTLSLSNVSGATLANANANGTIVNDDALPTLTLADASVLEGDGGTVTAEIVATLSKASGADVHFDWSTLDGIAKAAGDYVAAFGTLTIPAGQLSASFQVAIQGDTLYEGPEQFAIAIDAASISGCEHDGSTTTVTIIDDDPTPTPQADLSISFDMIKMSEIAIPGEKGLVKLSLANIGQARALGLLGVRLYASIDGLLDSGDVLLGEVAPRKAAIHQGRSKPYVVRFTVPDTLSDTQNYRLLAVADIDQAVGDANAANDTAVDAATHSSPWRFGQTSGQNNAVLAVHTPEGHSVSLRLTGGGWGEVIGRDDFTQILLHETGARSVFTVTTAGGATVEAGSLIADNDLRLINAAAVSLSANSSLSAPTIKLGDLSGSATLSLGAAGRNLFLDEIENASILAAGNLGKVRLSRWLDTDATADILSAEGIANITVSGVRGGPAGDFQASLLVSGSLVSAKVTGDLDGDWTLGSAGAITVKGDMNATTMELLSPLTGRSQALRSLRVGGVIADSRIDAAGDIGTIIADGLKSVDILAGVSGLAVDGRRAETAANFTAPATIKTIRLTGNGSATERFLADSHISAATLGTIILTNGDFDGSQISFNALSDGSGREIRLIKHIDRADRTQNWTYPTRADKPFEGPGDIIRLL